VNGPNTTSNPRVLLDATVHFWLSEWDGTTLEHLSEKIGDPKNPKRPLNNDL